MNVETEREAEGRWIAEVTDLSGVMVYGTTEPEAIMKAMCLALRVISERIEHGEPLPEGLVSHSEAGTFTLPELSFVRVAA